MTSEDLYDLRWDALRRVKTLLKISPEVNFSGPFSTGLGFKDWWNLVEVLEDENKNKKLIHTLEILRGPHALTVWYAIQARRQHE